MKIKGTPQKATEYVCVGAAEQQVAVSPLLPVCVHLPAVFQVNLRYCSLCEGAVAVFLLIFITR